MKWILIVAPIFACISGCGSAEPRLTRVSVGMTKAEVIAAVGRPRQTAAVGGTEVLKYDEISRGFGDAWSGYRQEVDVLLRNGRVTGYGTPVELGLAKPVPRLNVDFEGRVHHYNY